VQQVLESEMDEALAAQKSERTMDRLGYRPGCYPRTLITRVGKIELRVPQDRQGHAALEQIQQSRGHASIITTERHLGVRQDLRDPACGRLDVGLDNRL
jgi:hypothetical protein